MNTEKYPDIYFEPKYASLYNINNKAEVVEYRFQNQYGLITHLFLKRKINIDINDGKEYFDIITPYGYGGPVIHYSNDKEALINSFIKEFESYTKTNNIIAEFIRFHPILRNGIDFKEVYNSIYDRKTVGTNLTYEDVIGTEFSKHKRKDIKKLLKNSDIKYVIETEPKNLNDFIGVYYSTLDKDRADKYYYFDSNYFNFLINSFQKNIVTCKVFLNDTLIAMGIYFRYNNFLHAHLSGSLSQFLKLSPAYILKYAMAIYGHENGYKLIHYGGGSSSDPNNTLFQFKKDFGKNTEFDFYIAKKIWNEKIYKEICELTHSDINSTFFPAYRNQR